MFGDFSWFARDRRTILCFPANPVFIATEYRVDHSVVDFAFDTATLLLKVCGDGSPCGGRPLCVFVVESVCVEDRLVREICKLDFCGWCERKEEVK